MLHATPVLPHRWPAFIAASCLAALAACSVDPRAPDTAGGAAGSGGESSASTTASGSAATSGGGGSGGGGSACTDVCPAPKGGVEHDCRYRFMYGVNYAWHHFGADFGGISQWQQAGVAASASEHQKNLADMRAHGASVVRWWVFPDFRGDGIEFDNNEIPTGLGGTAAADLQKALELAEEADVYLMLCLFSFDAFRPSEEVAGVWTPGITPMVTSDQKRKMLLENVVRPVAKAVSESPHKKRLIAWDIINEPEWAMTGVSPYGDPDYDPIAELAPVTHAQMEAFIAETIGVLREESDALITVGGAAMKWSKAWSAVDVDFYQFHIYDWVNQYWPYTGSPSDYGVNDKPVVMGEFPLGGLSGASYGEMLSSFYENGYSGGLGWQYNEADAAKLDAVKAFAEAHPCETSY